MTRDTERHRQQALVRRLLAPGTGTLPPGLRPHRLARGLAAYEAHAAGVAERALAGTFPTVQAMLGEEPFCRLAWVFWAAHPPSRGDLAAWGTELPHFLANDATLAQWPYLADCARLDAAVSRCAASADAVADLTTLTHLGDCDPHRLQLELAPCVAVVQSPFPVVTLWRAHRAAASPTRLSEAREALADGRPECALLWRAGWRPEVSPIDTPAAKFTAALADGVSLGQALACAGKAFAFEPWLVSAVRDGWLVRVRISV